MMFLFEIRAKLTELYQKYDYLVLLVLRFVLVYITLIQIKGAVGFQPTLSKGIVVLAIAFIGAILPTSLMVLVIIGYVFLQIYTASQLMAITVLFLSIIMYCFFLRFTPKQGAVVIAVPVLRGLGFPYIVPLSMGTFSNL